MITEKEDKIDKKINEINLLKKEIDLIRKELGTYQDTLSNSTLDIPYVPSSLHKVQIMLSSAGNVTGKKMADFGSGDGRIVITFAKKGAIAHGYKLEPKRVALSKENLMENAVIFQKNIWDVDLSDYDIITIYGLNSVMEKLEDKVSREGKNGLMVISNRFEFPNWPHQKEVDGVYLYIKK